LSRYQIPQIRLSETHQLIVEQGIEDIRVEFINSTTSIISQHVCSQVTICSTLPVYAHTQTVPFAYRQKLITINNNKDEVYKKRRPLITPTEMPTHSMGVVKERGEEGPSIEEAGRI
jgi:hypothetical protein